MGTLHEAAAAGDLGELTRLIEAGADVNADEGGGWTPLMSACLFGHEACARLLIAAGADVNARDSEGTTALMLAQSGGHGGCAALLRAAGARE